MSAGGSARKRLKPKALRVLESAEAFRRKVLEEQERRAYAERPRFSPTTEDIELAQRILRLRRMRAGPQVTILDGID